MDSMINDLKKLSLNIDGDIYTDNTSRIIYSTDASTYREKPLAIAIPKNKHDIVKLVKFASQYKTSLIPRAAGTSLDGPGPGAFNLKYSNAATHRSKEEY